MFIDRKAEAQALRNQGYSVGYIAQRIGASRSSVSIWVKEIVLTKKQIDALRRNSHSPEAIEKRRIARLNGELKKRQIITEEARASVRRISQRELWLMGVMLYWAEGGKTQRMVRFSNGDPQMITIMMRFFREICEVPEKKFRGYIHIHEHLDTQQAEEYWAKIANLPPNQFFKTYNKPNKSSKNTRNSLPYGVCDIYVLDSSLFLRIKGWSEGIFEICEQNINNTRPR